MSSKDNLKIIFGRGKFKRQISKMELRETSNRNDMDVISFVNKNDSDIFKEKDGIEKFIKNAIEKYSYKKYSKITFCYVHPKAKVNKRWLEEFGKEFSKKEIEFVGVEGEDPNEIGYEII